MSIRWTVPQNPILNPAGMSRLVDELLRHTAGASRTSDSGGEEVVQSSWTPAVDVKETEEALTLFVELPGIKKDEINISIENAVLTVSGERRFPKDEEESYHRVERVYGKFARSFRVPRDADPNRVTAAFEDGVLRLDLPKVEAAKPRQIKIS